MVDKKLTIEDVFEHFNRDGQFVLTDKWGREDERVKKFQELLPRITILKGGILKEQRCYFVCKVGDFFEREDKYLFADFWLSDFDSVLCEEVKRGGYEYTGKHIEDSYLVLVFGYIDSGMDKFAVSCGIVDSTVDLSNTCIALEPWSRNLINNPPEGYYHLFRVGNKEHKYTKVIKHIGENLCSSFSSLRWMFNLGYTQVSKLEDDLEYIIEQGKDIKDYFPGMCGEKIPFRDATEKEEE